MYSISFLVLAGDDSVASDVMSSSRQDTDTDTDINSSAKKKKKKHSTKDKDKDKDKVQNAWLLLILDFRYFLCQIWFS